MVSGLIILTSGLGPVISLFVAVPLWLALTSVVFCLVGTALAGGLVLAVFLLDDRIFCTAEPIAHPAWLLAISALSHLTSVPTPPPRGRSARCVSF